MSLNTSFFDAKLKVLEDESIKLSQEVDELKRREVNPTLLKCLYFINFIVNPILFYIVI